jgi:hypothetical protein
VSCSTLTLRSSTATPSAGVQSPATRLASALAGNRSADQTRIVPALANDPHWA